MKVTGIICEYNPLHLGHKKQIDTVRAIRGEDCAVVCLMSGNFVQRGAPAIIDKMRRAKAAVLCGADLVLELPVTCALSSAEGFAAGGVRLLSGFCDTLCFGAETADARQLTALAGALLGDGFSAALHQRLDTGLSFPAARQAALEDLGLEAGILKAPNNILAVEYCKAILSQDSRLIPMPIERRGSYHDTTPDPENPSATAVRALMVDPLLWQQYVPEEAAGCFRNAPLHTTAAAERGILHRLRSMTDAEFEALPFGSEGLWRKLMHAARREADLSSIIASVKSKRYTRTRLDRMILCAFLGITEAQLHAPVPYARVLAFNDRGREVLKLARRQGDYPNIGQPVDHPYQLLENRCGDMYGLFAVDTPEPPGQEAQLRVFYHSQPLSRSHQGGTPL